MPKRGRSEGSITKSSRRRASKKPSILLVNAPSGDKHVTVSRKLAILLGFALVGALTGALVAQSDPGTARLRFDDQIIELPCAFVEVRTVSVAPNAELPARVEDADISALTNRGRHEYENLTDTLLVRRNAAGGVIEVLSIEQIDNGFIATQGASCVEGSP